MNDDKYKMNVEEKENEVKEENKISKFQLSNIIIACAMGLNYIFLIILGSGIFDRSTSNLFETYFKLSFTLIPFACILALIIVKNNYERDKEYEKKDIKIYLPFIQSVLIILLFGVKFTIQLSREILFELVVLTLSFVVLQGVLVLIMIENKISKKKYYILNAITFITMIIFVVLIIILANDYSVLL